MNRGPFAVVLLEDDQGHRTSVKTRDDVEIARFQDQAKSGGTHPALGRRLRIEYQDIAADGGYRHPRWDRWEDE